MLPPTGAYRFGPQAIAPQAVQTPRPAAASFTLPADFATFLRPMSTGAPQPLGSDMQQALAGLRAALQPTVSGLSLRLMSWLASWRPVAPAPSPAPAPAPAPAPISGAMPGPQTTGPAAGVALKPVDGPIRVTQDGAVLEGLDIDGHVTIRNCRIRAKSWYGLRVESGRGTLVDQVELNGQLHHNNNSGISGSHLTVRRSNIHGFADGVKLGSNSVYEGNWIHDMGGKPGGHFDGMQATGGSNILIRGNRIERAGNAAIILKSDKGPIRDVTVEGNWLSGGNYTVYVRKGNTGDDGPVGVRLIDNQLGRDHKYGPISKDVSVEARGNVFADNRQAAF